MRRAPNWQSALSRYIVSRAHAPFRYGVMDCGLFVADALAAMTGDDVAQELRGRYTTRREAFAHIERICGAPTMQAVAEYLAARNGLNEVPVTMAQRGDPLILRHGARSSLAIADLAPGYLLTPYRDGLLRLRIDLATRAYHLE